MRALFKILTAGLGLVLLAGMSFGQLPRFEISLLGGIARVGAFGDAADYAAGVNDFPTTPKYGAASFGGLLGLSLGRHFGLEAGLRYQTGADVVLTDPSDEDTVSFKTLAHFSAVLRAVFALPLGPVRLYILGGGGLDMLSGDAQSGVTAYGYAVEFEKPDQMIRPLVEAGGGLKLALGLHFGLRAEARYEFIFADPGSIKTLHAEGGIFVRI
ncbi:MAG: hypothetical protein PHI34_01315 [Acidobacteriota bacterium]|nr:hypothetical protein [Acidobacteriota bacterium]